MQRPDPAADPYGVSALGADFAGWKQTLLSRSASAGPPGPPGPVAAAGAQAGDECPHCHVPLRVIKFDYECPDCRAVYPAADPGEILAVSQPREPGAAARVGRLRVVGAGSRWFQHDLDRSNPVDRAAVGMLGTLSELKGMNASFKASGHNPFPNNILALVASNYAAVQADGVKRSNIKRQILASLIMHAGYAENIAFLQSEAAACVGLAGHGIAAGDDYLRSISDKLDLDPNRCQLDPHIASAFALLELSGPEHEALRAAVRAVIVRAEEFFIGAQSELRSKVIATTCEVICRAPPGTVHPDRFRGVVKARRPRGKKAAKAAAAPGPPAVSNETVVAWVVQKCTIRKHTIDRYRLALADHHSRFADIYASYGLSAAGPP